MAEAAQSGRSHCKVVAIIAEGEARGHCATPAAHRRHRERLFLIALLYLGYDLAKGRLSPCEAIFRETSLALKTKISFLKTEGELEIGREQLTDLDERAQMTALNLKTCCTVLDAGRLDPEQFLQCKGSARAYEASLSDIANLVRQAVKEGLTTSSIAASAATRPSSFAVAPA